MESRSQTSSCLFLSIQILLSFIFSSHAADTISSGQSLIYGQTLISRNGTFGLGFFSPGNSMNYYIGIWYKKVSLLENTKVWVANRDAPIGDNLASSELKLTEDGNLVLFDGSVPIWSSNTTSNVNNNSTEAVLRDDGNLVLRNGVGVLWQSFDNPTDTWLPGARIGYDKRSNKSQILTSWKSPDDPSKGVFSLQIEPNTDQIVIKTKDTQMYWSSGPWNGQIFTGVPEFLSIYIFNFNHVENANESYFTYDVYNSSLILRFVMSLSGQIQQSSWNDPIQDWFLFWSQPRQHCDVYAYCGAFGVCNQNHMPYCKCVDGFEPRDPRDWYGSDSFAGGCVRKTSLQCGDKDGFLLMPHAKLPVNQQFLTVTREDECRLACLNDCSCHTYANYNGNCSIWKGNLLNLEQLSDNDTRGGDVYIKHAASELQTSGGNNTDGGDVYKKGSNTWIIVGVVAGVLVLGLVAAVLGIVFNKRPSRKGKKITLNKEENLSTNDIPKEDLELPLFDLVTVATATDQFSLSCKIGQGGFGPVYKGVLPTGEEIAIKRLSKHSRQGIQEFMNEVLLIAKLQHRNLVRLLGCCIHGEENMLIYEYMPNGSLDSFIFDKRRSIDLNWRLRFNIIVGIARGLLYLHRDSRLTIIHRDLKAGNVLLDNKMNPKISDFGMAKTFGGDQTEQNTMRVVGTYGYMSPEYATDGLFSMKSDVFSFGVLILEIVSGKKNRGFHHASHDLNLLGHTWKLLMDNKALELMDESIKHPFSALEVLKCIQVGLLCVQKFPDDRPTMASVVSMLDTDGAVFPCPKQPGFYTERSPLDVMPSPIPDIVYTVNGVTDTLLEGR